MSALVKVTCCVGSAENDEMEYFSVCVCVCVCVLAHLYVPQKTHAQVSVTFILYMGQIV